MSSKRHTVRSHTADHHNHSYAPISKEDTGMGEEGGDAHLLDQATVVEAIDEDQTSCDRGSRDMVMTMGEARDAGTIWSRMCDSVEHIIESEYFDYLIGGVILANAVVIGMETEYMAANWSTEIPLVYRMIDRIFCIIFLAEVCMRFCVSGVSFFYEPGWKWNVFDLLVVAMQVFDEALGAMTHIEKAKQLKSFAGRQLSTMRILRLFRLIRLLRLTRMLYLLGGLRMLVVSITDSLRSLAWTLFLLFGLTFVFAVFLTQLVTDHKVRGTEEEREEMEELLYFFGSLDRSMLCLYETISEGNHWHEVVKPLMEQCGRWLALVFIMYMSFTLFALMNVVTGVFL